MGEVPLKSRLLGCRQRLFSPLPEDNFAAVRILAAGIGMFFRTKMLHCQIGCHRCVATRCKETALSGNGLRLSEAEPAERQVVRTCRRDVDGMESMSDNRWFTVHTLPRKETVAVHHLERQGYRTFFPLLPVTRRHARKQDTVLAALFPRYAFVQIDLGRDRWRAINGTIGVTSLVTMLERPCPVPVGIVEALARHVGPDGVIRLEERLHPEDQMRIVDGPMAGNLGTLMRLDENGRVEMLLDLMRASVRVKVARNMLESVY